MCYVWRMVTSSNSFGSDDENTHAQFPCEDAPCCGCCPSIGEYYDPSEQIEAEAFDGDDCTQDLGEDEGDGMTDGEADADALASGGEDRWLDSHWESQNEVDFGGDF